jgi:alpha-L-arabinofuranosidase
MRCAIHRLVKPVNVSVGLNFSSIGDSEAQSSLIKVNPGSIARNFSCIGNSVPRVGPGARRIKVIFFETPRISAMMTTVYRGSMSHITALAILLGGFTAAAQSAIFDENFDGAYSGGFSTSSYSGGSPTDTSDKVLTTGGNPNGCFEVTMTATTSGDYFAGQVQLTTVSGNTDSNPSDYVLSFDAYGSQAGNIQFLIQDWSGDYFGGSGPLIDVTVNDPLNSANAWQTFSVNLGDITTASPAGGTWQLSFQINSSQWGGAGLVDTLKIDNIILTHLANSLALTSSLNPSADGAGVTFTATIVTNGITADNAAGQVVFSYAGGPFSTNALSGGSATSAPITNLPVGTDSITAVYSDGNYPAGTNTVSQAVSAPTSPVIAQNNLPIYTDNLVNGFQNWSWATVDLENLDPPAHSGTYSVSVTDAGYQALAFECTEVNSSTYTSLSFWVNGGEGGQKVEVWGLLDHNNQTAYPLATLPANIWQQITVPLSALGVSNKPNFTGFLIQGTTGKAQSTFYVDDVQLVAAPPPAVVHLGVDAANVLGTVDARQFGLNTATWDGSLGASQTLPMLEQMGCMALRWPGGSTSDGYDWTSDPGGNSTFRYIATNLGAQVFTTVNYGTGTASEAAGWVSSANKTYQCAFKYWEIGNECYGTWETDDHAIPHDPYTYATNAAAYIQQMKAAYPAVPIKVGVVVVPGEGSYSNNATHFAVNPRTGTTNYGWTPIVLSEMSKLGVLPDFLIYHFYWQYTSSGWTYYSESPDSDPLLLQVAGNPSPFTWSDWASAASSLRQQIEDYIGAPGTNIELCVTENNSDSGAMGRQSTSLINALYLADSTCQLMKTEFKSYLWWDLHNGADTDGDFDPTIYGWRTNGDYGVLNGADVPYPTFYAGKLLQYFARPGDAVLGGTSDNPLLSAYAVHRANGALTLLVINKDMTTNLGGEIQLTNFAPWTTATVQSYGIAQDEAAGPAAGPESPDIATSSYSPVGTNFAYEFPPLSLTLFTFAPGPAMLSALGVQSAQVQLGLQGQSNATYVIQRSADLVNWISISSNTLAGNTATINVPVLTNFPQQYYRAVWQP